MPTWKLHKGESKTFEGTVLIATISGGAQTNYDITNATMGFDMGSIMGNWMIRVNSTVGSVGTNMLFNPDFSLGTSFWEETSFGSTIFTETSEFTAPYASALAMNMAGTGTMIVTGSRVLVGAGTYYSRYRARMGANDVAATLGTFTLPAPVGFLRPMSKGSWSSVEGVIGKSGDTSAVPSIRVQIANGGVIATAYFDDFFMGRVVATSNFQIITGSMGVYRYSWEPIDTENLTATSYYFDIWLRTTAGKEYTLTVGTLVLLPVVGTF